MWGDNRNNYSVIQNKIEETERNFMSLEYET